MGELAALVVVESLHKDVALFQEKEQELGRLDAAAGDGDHGTTMLRGVTAAVAAIDAQGPCSGGELLICAGDAFADAAGGASGALLAPCSQQWGASCQRQMFLLML